MIDTRDTSAIAIKRQKTLLRYLDVIWKSSSLMISFTLIWQGHVLATNVVIWCLDPEYETKPLLRNIFFPWKKYMSPSVYHQYHCHHCNQRGRVVWGGAGVPRQHQCLSSISFLFHLKHPTNYLEEENHYTTHHTTRQARIFDFENLPVKV